MKKFPSQVPPPVLLKWFEITSEPGTCGGDSCVWCKERIQAGDEGVLIPHHDLDAVTERPYHTNCFLRTIVGSVGHQEGRCSCYGGTEEDPPNLTRRQAANAAVERYSNELS